jgi:hypothetical protein
MTDFLTQVILAVVSLIMGLVAAIFTFRLTKKQEAEKEAQKQKEERQKVFLGPGGVAPKDINEAVRIAENEGRNTKLPRIIGTNLLVILIALFVAGTVYGLGSIAEEMIRRYSQDSQPTLMVVPESGSQLSVKAKVVETVCENERIIEYSLVDVSIDGGLAPYELTIKNSDLQITGSFTIKNNVPARIKVFGGDSVSAQIRAKNGESWSGIITLPADYEYCKRIGTFKTTPSSTFTDIPVPTNTKIIMVATNTPRQSSPVATNTNKPVAATSTTVPVIFSPTSQPPTIAPPQATSTSPAQRTNTSAPVQTTATSQSTSAPNLQECEDGLDNDGDTLIDMADPQCSKPSDPHENK